MLVGVSDGMVRLFYFSRKNVKGIIGVLRLCGRERKRMSFALPGREE